MLQVYLQQTIADANARDDRAGPYAAEIVPGCTPQWHVLVTAANQESIAAGHLIRRRFGIYQPRYERRVRLASGSVTLRQANLLPGYLFLFVWDIERHWRRIKDCTGVVGALHDGSGYPAVVPDHLIDRLQAHEFSKESMPSRYQQNKKRSRRERALDAEQQRDLVKIYTKSYWRDLDSVDSTERLGAFRKAMMLAS